MAILVARLFTAKLTIYSLCFVMDGVLLLFWEEEYAYQYRILLHLDCMMQIFCLEPEGSFHLCISVGCCRLSLGLLQSQIDFLVRASLWVLCHLWVCSSLFFAPPAL